MTKELIPLFASALMVAVFAIEIFVSRLLRDHHYDLKDAGTNLAIGAGYLVCNLAWSLLTAGVFLGIWLITPLRFDMSSGWSWLVLVLAQDFLFYWSHRASHTFGVMWASHTVHHSSPKLNLSTGMRNSWVGGAIDWVFMLPLAAIGFDPLSIAIVQVTATAWNFLAHAAYVPRLPILDEIFNTPANHRVHHSQRVDEARRNYGAVLIVWDRLFGTYRRGDASYAYGIDPPPARPYNPVHLELAPWGAYLRGLLRRRDGGTPSA